MERMTTEFVEAFKQSKETIFVAIIDNPHARRWKYEVYWFNNYEDKIDNVPAIDHVDECHNRYCENHTQAAAYAFDAIKEAVDNSPAIVLSIHDFTT